MNREKVVNIVEAFILLFEFLLFVSSSACSFTICVFPCTLPTHHLNTRNFKMASFNSAVPGKSDAVGFRREPIVVDDKAKIEKEHYYLPNHYRDFLSTLLVTQGTIKDRVEKLAHDIIEDYQGETVHLLCVLKGGATFFGDLSEALGKFHDCEC